MRNVDLQPDQAGTFRFHYERGDNSYLRRLRPAELRVMCGRRLAAVVTRENGAPVVVTAGAAAPLTVLLDGSGFDELEVVCPCGRLHVLDVAKVREAHARLRYSPVKARFVTVDRLPPG